ncbi:MAG: type II secretion system major pseudopilin GspG [Kiritimatiellaeota bacterium]|nr:type II secretion system major pseudopilin GspG [Kiritimatiellota bacterium]
MKYGSSEVQKFGSSEVRKNVSGFSLLEILISIVIITILGTVVGLSLLNQVEKAKVKTAKMQIAELKSAVVLYAAENGAVPTPRQGLDAIIKPTTIPPLPKPFKTGEYFDALEVPKDPWGNDYVYLVPGRNGETFEIITYGADVNDEAGAISSSKP